jgi:predicted RNase H-like HicB family nuclease
MNFDIELEQEEDGRWIAEIPEIPGVLAYGVTPLQAEAKAKALALRVLAERMENEVSIPGINSILFASHFLVVFRDKICSKEFKNFHFQAFCKPGEGFNLGKHFASFDI